MTKKKNKWGKTKPFFFAFALLLLFAEGVKNQDTATYFYSKGTAILLYKLQQHSCMRMRIKCQVHAIEIFRQQIYFCIYVSEGVVTLW
jgi:hypothetical protein